MRGVSGYRAISAATGARLPLVAGAYRESPRIDMVAVAAPTDDSASVVNVVLVMKVTASEQRAWYVSTSLLPEASKR
jgi:hypothetical protein